jgi:predicted enzyme related to lactoylglutathione lyase
MTTPFLGLRTAIYHVGDLARAKAWYSDVLGFGPYFDEPFYVGFEVGGYELGLNPDLTNVTPGGSAYVYWGVEDAHAAYDRLLALGATAHEPVNEVGGGILVGTVKDPWDNVLGVIHNPHFKLA